MSLQCECGNEVFETVGSRSSAGLTEIVCCQKCGRPAASYAHPKKFNFRFVEVRGVKYLRAEDVAAYVRNLGSTEETDVRNRLDTAARHLIEDLTSDQRADAAHFLPHYREADALLREAAATVGTEDWIHVANRALHFLRRIFVDDKPLHASPYEVTRGKVGS